MMGILSSVTLKIKRREGPVYGFLYSLAKAMLSLSLPCIKPIHLPLYYADRAVRNVAGLLYQGLWAVPLFKARCEQVGRRLHLPNGLPWVEGDHLRILLGDEVTIMRTTIGASKVIDRPVLRIGNRSTIGYGTMISVSREVSIGDDCLVGPGCLIMDSDDHPVQPGRRLAREPVAPDEVQFVRIGNNVWIGSGVTILKGVSIGDNCIVSAQSVVTKDAVANSIYAGFPARPVVRDIDKLQG